MCQIPKDIQKLRMPCIFIMICSIARAASYSLSLAYKIGDYAVDKDGTVTGPASKELIEALEAKGYFILADVNAMVCITAKIILTIIDVSCMMLTLILINVR